MREKGSYKDIEKNIAKRKVGEGHTHSISDRNKIKTVRKYCEQKNGAKEKNRFANNNEIIEKINKLRSGSEEIRRGRKKKKKKNENIEKINKLRRRERRTRQ